MNPLRCQENTKAAIKDTKKSTKSANPIWKVKNYLTIITVSV